MLTITPHAGHAIGEPDLIALSSNFYALRFETMKAVSARGALHHLLSNGTISTGDTVIDSSSGIYAHALALACHEAGLRCRIIGSTTIDPVLRAQLHHLGAHLEQMPASTSLKLDQDRRVARIQELLKEHPDWHWMAQYHSKEHYLGYRRIAFDLAECLNRAGHDRVQLVAPVGSGASSGAMCLGLRDSGLPTTVVGVQPFGSVTFGSEHIEDPDMLIAGIGSSIEFRNIRRELYSTIHWVSYRVGKAGSRELLSRHALFAGLSSGAAYAAATFERDGRPSPHPDTATVIIVPDTGHRYVESVFAPGSNEDDPEEVLGDFSPLVLSPGADKSEMRLPWSVQDLTGN